MSIDSTAPCRLHPTAQTRFFTRLAFLLPSLLSLIESTIDQEIEGLARIGVACLRLVLKGACDAPIKHTRIPPPRPATRPLYPAPTAAHPAEAGPRFDTAVWDMVATSLRRLFDACTPSPLLDARATLLPDADAAEHHHHRDAAEGAATFSDEEDDDEGEGAAKARGAGQRPARAAAHAGAAALDAVAAWQRASVGGTVPTPYGPGVVLALTAATAGGDGDAAAQTGPFATVQLPWGVLHAHVPSVVSALRTAVTATAPSSTQVQAAAATKRRVVSVRGAAPPTPAAPPAVKAPAARLPFNSVRVVTQCVVQLELIASVGVLADAHLDSLTLNHVLALLGLLESSADFARRFNADRPLRRALWEAGFMRYTRNNKLPSLLRQETSATNQLLILLMRLYDYDHTRERLEAQATGGAPRTASAAAAATDPGSSASSSGEGSSPHVGGAWKALSVSRLRVLAVGMVNRYTQLAIEVERARTLATPSFMHGAVSFGGSLPTERTGVLATGVAASATSLLDGAGNVDRDLFREAAAYGPLVMTLLRGLLAFDENQFRETLEWLYPLLTGLVVAGNLEIRALLASVFEGRLAVLLGLRATAPAPAGLGSASSSFMDEGGRAPSRDVRLESADEPGGIQ